MSRKATPIPFHYTISLGSPDALRELLERGQFLTDSFIDQPWESDKVIWQTFLCGRDNVVASASIAMFKDGTEPPMVSIQPMRKLLWFFHWPRDLRLMRAISAWFEENGAQAMQDRNASHT